MTTAEKIRELALMANSEHHCNHCTYRLSRLAEANPWTLDELKPLADEWYEAHPDFEASVLAFLDWLEAGLGTGT